MRWLSAALALMAICAFGAVAAQDRPHKFTSSEVRKLLAGEWRAHRTGAADTCGKQARADDYRFTIQYSAANKQIAFNDGAKDFAPSAIALIYQAEDNLKIVLRDKRTWLFLDNAKGQLKSEEPPVGWEATKGRLFYRCQ